MYKIIATFLLICCTVYSKASVREADTSKGIQWTTGLSWEQVKEKAKHENKYVFIDAFATWCGPCKKMDKETFRTTDVVQAISEKFIPVKLQMDKTKNDNEEVKNWYKDASALGKQYWINSYPTYIFLSPQGEIVHKVSGYRDVKGFLRDIATSLKPGKTYVNPNEAYFKLKDEYEAGTKGISAIPVLFKGALKLSATEAEFARKISKTYRDHLATLPADQLYTQEIIEFITGHTLTSRSAYFNMFYKNGKKVDKAMNVSGYAQSAVDQIIQLEIVDSLLKIKSGGMRISGGPTLYVEADWEGIYKAIKSKYDKQYAQRNIADAKLKWYRVKNNRVKHLATMTEAVNKYGLDTINKRGERAYGEVNGLSWFLFMNSTDSTQLTAAMLLMAKIVDSKIATNNWTYSVYLDTYANLLHRFGRTEEAIYWEEKSLKFLKGYGVDDSNIYVKEYQKALAKMKSGIPTWPVPKDPK